MERCGAGAAFRPSEPFQSRLGGDDAPGDIPDQLLANRDGEIAETLDGHDKGAATSLARLWRNQDRTDEARDLLAPAHSWFTEGFDTADLKDAKTLLGELK